VKAIPVEESKISLPELAQLAKDGVIILTRRGKPLVSVTDVTGSDWEAIALSSNPTFIALIEESRRQYREMGGIGLDELRRELAPKAAPRRPKRGKPRSR
jgi:hypothetical protein